MNPNVAKKCEAGLGKFDIVRIYTFLKAEANLNNLNLKRKMFTTQKKLLFFSSSKGRIG